jgi:uncharacterized protein with PQ loop repeat
MLGQVLGWLATLLFVICYVPQIIKSRKKKDLSLAFISLYLLGNIVALVYSIIIQQRPLQVKYTLEIILVSIIYAYRFKQSFGKNADTKRRSNQNQSGLG